MRRAGRILWALYAFLLVSLFVTNAMALDVDVSVNNNTNKAGRVYVTIENEYGGGTGVGKSLFLDVQEMNDFMVRGLPDGDGTYRAKAFMDVQGYGAQHANDPYGETTFTVSGGAVTASGGNPSSTVNVSVSDPDPVAAVTVPSVNMIPGSDWAMVMWDTAKTASGLEVADSYNIYWSTQPNPGPNNTTGGDMRAGAPAVDGGPMLITGLTPGTSYYVAVVPVVNGEEVLDAKAVTTDPAVIGTPQPSSGSSVTVTVKSAGIPKNGDWPTPLVVAVSDDKDNVRLAVVNNPGDSQTVTVTGVPAGTYRVFTALDTMDNGYLDGGMGVIGLSDTLAPMVTVDGTNPVTADTIDLSSQLTTNADVRLSIDHGRTQGVPDSDTYSVSLDVQDQANHVINVSYDTLGVDVAREDWGHEFNYTTTLSQRPNVGDAFPITVEYADGTIESLQPKVSTVLDSFPTATAPVGKTSNTSPTFTWSAPDVPPQYFSYSLWMNDGMNTNFGTDDIPSSQLSLPFDFDGARPALNTGDYQWSIAVTDLKGNSAHENVAFTVTDPPISFSGVVKNTSGTGVAGITVEVAEDMSLTTTSAGDGSFTISGIPSGQNFTIKATGGGFADSYVGPFNSTSDITGRTIRVYSPTETGNWGGTTGKGIITGKVVVPGTNVALQGATVSIVSATGSYSVLYADSNGNPAAGSSTSANGKFYILNVNDGDAVTLTATMNGWTFPNRVSTGHAGSVTAGDIAANTIEFDGKLVDTAGQAVAGASVQLSGYPAIATTTASDGTFALSAVPSDAEFTLVFGKDGFAPLYTAAIQSKDDINDTIPIVIFTQSEVGGPSSALVTGVVVDPAAGPIAGASVNVTSTMHPEGYPVTYFDGTNYGGFTTYANGIFAVQNVADGDTVTATAFKGGYSPASQKFVAHAGAATEGLVFISGSSVSFSGSVVDNSNNPVSGATVQMAGNSWLSATTQVDGTFTLQGLPKDTPFSVVVTKPGYLPVYSGNMSASYDTWATAPYTLYTADQAAKFGATTGKGIIRTRVVDSGNPTSGFLSGAVVTASSTQHPDTPYPVTYFDGASVGGSATYENGVFIVANVDDGDTVTVTATRDGYSTGNKSYTVHANTVTEGRLALDYIALLTSTPASYDFGSVAVGNSSATRQFTLSNVSSVPLGITGSGTGMFGTDAAMFNVSSANLTNPCPTPPFNLYPGQTCSLNITFTPTSAGPRSGSLNVVAASHTYSFPVSGYAFDYVPSPAITSVTPGNGTVGTQVVISGSNFSTDPNGNTVTFNGTPATVTSTSATSLTVTVPNGAGSGPVSVINTGGTAFSAIPFTVINSVSLSGSVTDSAGRGLAGATVAKADNPSITTTTDDYGNFVLGGLPAGSDFSVVVSAYGYVPSYTRNFNTTSNIVSLSSYALFTANELSSWGATAGKGVIRSRVADAANQDAGYISGATVTATSVVTNKSYSVVYYDGTNYGGTTTFPNGMYMVLNVDDGDTVQVTATKNGWSTGSRTFVAHGDAVSQGRILLAGPVIQYSGSATDSANKGVGGAIVASSGNPAAYTTTADDGSFALSNLPMGSTFSLQLSKNGYLPVYSFDMNGGSAMTAPAPFTFYTADETAALGVTKGKGVIKTFIVDNANPATGYLAQAQVFAVSQKTGKSYPVKYFDGTNWGGSYTYTNGMVMVPDIDDGDVVALTVGKSGYSAGSKTYVYHVHADAVSEGRVRLSKMTLTATTVDDFGYVTVGSSSLQQIVTIKNISLGDVTLAATAVAGTDAAMFSFIPAGTNPCRLSVAMASGNSCTMGVRFIPTNDGVRSAIGTITTTDSNVPALPVPFSGNGVFDTLPPYGVSISAPAVYNGLSVPVSVSASDDIGVAGYMIVAATGTTVPATPKAGDAGWIAGTPTTFKVPAAGIYTLYAWAKDGGGNVSLAYGKSGQVTVDTTVPTLTLTVANANALKVPVSFTAADGGSPVTGVTGYMITTSALSTAALQASTAWIPVTATASFTAAPTLTYSFTTVGPKTLYVYVKDGAGNITGKSATFNIDMTAPSVGTFTVPAAAKTLTVPVVFTGSDPTTPAGYTGVKGYAITTAPVAPAVTSTAWSATAPTSYTFPGEGGYTLYAWVKDGAGNISAAKSAAVTIDTTAPVVTFSVPAAVKTLAVPVTLSATNATGYMITATSTAPLATATGWSATAPTSYTFTSTGSKILYAWAKDAAGNVSAAKSATTVIDTTAPVVTGFTVKTPATTLTVPVTVTATGATGYMLTATSVAPLATATGWTSTPPTSYTFTSSGSKLLWAWAKDDAGNVSLSKSAATTITLTGPVITSFSVPSAVKTLTIPVTTFMAVNGTGFQITLTSTPPLASSTAWKTTAPTSYAVTTAGLKTLYAWVRDAQGRISPAASATVNVDMTAPVITAFTVKPVVNSLSIPVTAFTATDAGGVAGYMITATSTAPLATATTWSATAPTSFAVTSGGVKTLYAWVKDAAGNVSAVKTATANVDVTAPVVTAFTMKTPVTTLTVPVASFTATDAVGVVGYKITESSTAPLVTATGWSTTAPTSYTFATKGTKVLYGWAKDAAGNVSLAKSFTVTIN